MIEIAIDVKALADTGIKSRTDGRKHKFEVGERAKDKTPIETAVHVKNGKMQFFPERSAKHKRLLKAMGYAPE